VIEVYVIITYFETGTKEICDISGELFFGDALLNDYLGVKKNNSYILVPSATVIRITVEDLDEELFMVDTDSIKRSKQIALKSMRNEMDREDTNGRPFHG
jgi:hypothetical protein